MGNGIPMTAGKIIAIAITASFAINGVAVTFTINAMNRQEAVVAELARTMYTKMDERYRRFEADAAHNNIRERIEAVEKRDDKLEVKVDEHISSGTP